MTPKKPVAVPTDGLAQPELNNKGAPRQRVAHACSKCRELKVKCDNRETCKECLQRNSLCIRDHSKKALSATDQEISMLQSAVSQLYDLVVEAGAWKGPHARRDQANRPILMDIVNSMGIVAATKPVEPGNISQKRRSHSLTRDGGSESPVVKTERISANTSPRGSVDSGNPAVPATNQQQQLFNPAFMASQSGQQPQEGQPDFDLSALPSLWKTRRDRLLDEHVPSPAASRTSSNFVLGRNLSNYASRNNSLNTNVSGSQSQNVSPTVSLFDQQGINSAFAQAGQQQSMGRPPYQQQLKQFSYPTNIKGEGANYSFANMSAINPGAQYNMPINPYRHQSDSPANFLEAQGRNHSDSSVQTTTTVDSPEVFTPPDDLGLMARDSSLLGASLSFADFDRMITTPTAAMMLEDSFDFDGYTRSEI